MNMYDECLRKALEDIKAHPDRKLVMGPPGYPEQTAHFWTEDDEKWYDRAAHTVPKTYIRRGKVVDPTSVIAELRKAGFDI